MKQHDLLHGSIRRGMIAFALPILLGQIFQQLYNTADAWIVGNYLSNQAYAAVSSSGSLVFLMIGFFSGISVGAGVVISRYFGANDTKTLRIAVHTTVAFGFASGLLLTVLGMTATPVILRLMGTPEEVLPYSVQYFRVYFAGSMAVSMYNLCVGIMQAVGDSRHPLYYLIISSVTNILLDFLFVAVLGWDVWSAALATTISQFVSMILCMTRLFRVKTDYRLRWREIRFDWAMTREIIRFGLPSGVQNSILGFANVVVQSNINAFDTVAMAGCGTYFKLEGFAFLPVTCFTMALTTFVSQNLGAKQYERAKKGTRFGLISCILTAELVGLLLNLFAEPLVGLFSDDAASVAVGVRQARLETLFYCVLAFSHCVAAIMRGAGRPVVPMLVMLFVWCILRVTYITIMVRFIHEVWIVYSAYPVTWCISSVIFAIFYFCTDWVHNFDRIAAKANA